MSDFGKPGAQHGLARVKMTNVAPHPQTVDMGFRDVRHKNDQTAVRPPPTLVRNHLHGSDMFIRNQLNNNSAESIAAMPPKFHRTVTPSGDRDSDYFSTSSRGSAITPPPFTRANTSPDYLHQTELPHRMEYPLTSPTKVLPRSAGSYHGRSSSSSSSQQFSAPKPVDEGSRKSRTRRRHSSIETSANASKEMTEPSSVHYTTRVPSRPQSSASNTHEQVHMVSNRLNRHKSYYEAVNNAAVTSQTVFAHRSERIQTLPEELSSSADTETSTFSSNTLCANSINLEMTNQQQEDTHHPSHDLRQSHWHDILSEDHYYPQSDSELVTSSPKTYPRRRGNSVQIPNPQIVDAAHPRLLNSTNPPSPLQISQRSSPKLQHRQFDPPVQQPSPQQQGRHRKFSYDSSHVHQTNGRVFTRTNNNNSPLTDKRIKHKPPPIVIPDFNQDDCFSDGELALRRGSSSQVTTGHKKFARKRNKSFTSSASSPSQTRSGSRPKSISSHVLHKIAKNFSRRGDPENTKVLHVFDEKDGNAQAVTSPPYTGQVESMPIIDSESNEPLNHRMRSHSIGNSTAYQDYQRTQSMELLSAKQPTDINGKEAAQSLDDLLHESSPAPTPTSKHVPKGWGSKRKKSVSLDTDVFLDASVRSTSKKSLIDSHEALFKAVINNNRVQVEQILTSNQSDLTWHNADDFTVLDVAVMLNHTLIAQLLMAYGARESPKFVRNPELRYNHLLHLLTAAEEQINKCRTNLSQSSINASSQALDEMTKLKEHWSTKKTMLQHMLSVYNSARPPDPPTSVQLEIASSHSLIVRFSEPKKDNGSPVTRYRVEWSKCYDFAVVEGSFVLSDLTYKLDPHSNSMEYTIPGLESGEKYFVRVSASNIKRFGPATYSVPSGAIPCSWHDVEGTEPRYTGSTDTIQTIAMQLRQVINESVANKDTAAGNTNTTGKSKMKRGLSKIFGGALKFHKNLKGGLYFALLMYTDDEKVLVTVDDYLPMVEVAESFNTQTIKQDFLWLSKLACTWENVKSMCDSSENYTNSSSIQFRNRLLHTIIDLQASLGINDLGLIHPLPYQNSDSLVIVLVKNMKDPREIQNSTLRWIPQGKLWKKHSSTTSVETLSIPDQLISEALSIMEHNTASVKPVTRGLYLGYLKTRSSLAGVKVVVSKQFPNLLPHTKIRDNPHISKDEWSWLTYLHQPKDETPPYVVMETCCELQKLLTMKVVELLTSRGITKKEEIEQHRLYINEVVELNENVSFLLLLPPPDQVCTSLGGTDRFEHVSYMGMPFTSFEIAQLYTYQKVFITLYTQVSSTLDMQLLIAQHRLREAFSKDEISQGKELQEKLEKFLQETERVWKNMHWLDSAVQIGRKTDNIHGIPLRSLRRNPMTTHSHSPSPSLLSNDSSDQGKQSQPEDHTTLQSKPQHSAQYKNRYSSTIEELKVTPLYNTGLAKGSTVKLHVLQMTQVKEVIQLAVKALEDARSKKQPERPPAVSNNPSDFYLLCTIDGGYNERILDDEFPILELYRESSDFKLFLKKKADLDSSDCYTTSV